MRPETDQPIAALLADLVPRQRVLVADNRLAYKRSTGHRGRFHRPGPLEWLRAGATGVVELPVGVNVLRLDRPGGQ